MPRYILMPEDGNIEKARKIEIPEAMIARSDKTPTNVTKSRVKFLNNRILGATKNKEKARKLLSFLKKNRISMDAVGNVCYQDTVLPDTHLEEMFCDLINGSRWIPPDNYELFYDILKDLDIDLNLISKNRVKYFK